MSSNPIPTPLEPLTPREMDVLKLVCTGLPNKAVAAQLGISFKTVEKHRGELNRKTGSNDSMSLLRNALLMELVTLEVCK